jgi:hypothetical protein
MSEGGSGVVLEEGSGGYCFFASQSSSWTTGLKSEVALASATLRQQESQEVRSPTDRQGLGVGRVGVMGLLPTRLVMETPRVS